jgi:hypothetical protein
MMIYHSVYIGDYEKDQLRNKLINENIQMNKYANDLFDSELFTISIRNKELNIIELNVKELGFSKGATINEIINRANTFHFSSCPFEVGPYLRLSYKDQKEEIETDKNKAPRGSITIISNIINEDDDFPKGFYIRKINNLLWLRGYISPMDYIFDNESNIALLDKND